MITIFRWGYWDWGNCADKFVKLADAVEKQAGFGKPIFVDVRFSRSSRAPNFRQNAFEKIVGPTRYRWMKDLGNAAYKEGKLEIANPAAANDLLDHALEAAESDRRVIFFCSCASPWDAGFCHRRKVGKLLLALARKRGVRIQVAEWPGGMPAARPQFVQQVQEQDIELLAAVPQGEPAYMNLGTRLTRKVTALAGLPSGALLKFRHGSRSVVAACMRVHFDTTRGGWTLTMAPMSSSPTQRKAGEEAQRIRKRLALIPEST